jgi:hypothetical protein
MNHTYMVGGKGVGQVGHPSAWFLDELKPKEINAYAIRICHGDSI